MIIKKFIGKNEEEATRLAKADLGENLVIMNVRKIKAKPPFAFLKSKRVELTAAVEEDDPSMEKIRRIARAQVSAQEKEKSAVSEKPSAGMVSIKPQASDNSKSIEEKLFVLPEDTQVFPGHGASTTISHEKKYNPFFTDEIW